MGLGFASWWVFLTGVLVGQSVTVINFFTWLHHQTGRESSVELAISRAVAEVLQTCLEAETTTTTTTTTPSLDFGFLEPGSGRRWGLWQLFLQTWVLIFILLVIFGCWCWRKDIKPSGTIDQLAIGEDSPKTSPVSLETLARNQLAEIRLRRHADRPHRAIGI